MIEKFRINASDPYEIQIIAPLYDYFQWQDLFSPTCPLVAASFNLTSTQYWGQERQVFELKYLDAEASTDSKLWAEVQKLFQVPEA